MDPEIVFVADTKNDGLEFGNFLELKFLFIVPIDQDLIQVLGIPCCDICVKIQCNDVEEIFGYVLFLSSRRDLRLFL